jgi:hypothetical protein
MPRTLFERLVMRLRSFNSWRVAGELGQPGLSRLSATEKDTALALEL